MDATAQRSALIQAAEAVIKRDGPDSLGMAATAAEAGVSFEVFRSHFPDEASFVAALHQHYLDTLLAHVGHATSTLPPGVRRLRAGVTRFLDVSLRRVRVRKALQRLKGSSPAVAAQMNHRHRAFAHLLAAELAAERWPLAIEAARLLRTMVEETARAELQALRELPKLRAALWSLVDGAAAAARPAPGRTGEFRVVGGKAA